MYKYQKKIFMIIVLVGMRKLNLKYLTKVIFYEYDHFLTTEIKKRKKKNCYYSLEKKMSNIKS